jgi:hypothetical protein
MKPPYTGKETAGLLALAAAQPTRLRAANVTALLLAGLGAGLDGTELHQARGSSVTADDGDVLVHVAGSRPRTVPVLARYAGPLLAAAERVGADGWLLGGRDGNRPNRVGFLTASVTTDLDVPRISTGRLRATWLLGVLRAGVRVDVLCAAAGLADPRMLGDLFSYLPALPTAELRAALTGQAARR